MTFHCRFFHVAKFRQNVIVDKEWNDFMTLEMSPLRVKSSGIRVHSINLFVSLPEVNGLSCIKEIK